MGIDSEQPQQAQFETTPPPTPVVEAKPSSDSSKAPELSRDIEEATERGKSAHDIIEKLAETEVGEKVKPGTIGVLMESVHGKIANIQAILEDPLLPGFAQSKEGIKRQQELATLQLEQTILDTAFIGNESAPVLDAAHSLYSMMTEIYDKDNAGEEVTGPMKELILDKVDPSLKSTDVANRMRGLIQQSVREYWKTSAQDDASVTSQAMVGGETSIADAKDQYESDTSRIVTETRVLLESAQKDPWALDYLRSNGVASNAEEFQDLKFREVQALKVDLMVIFGKKAVEGILHPASSAEPVSTS